MARRRKIIEGQAVLEGQYRVIYADYPWPYGDRPKSGSGAQQHYPGMPIDGGLSLAGRGARDAGRGPVLLGHGSRTFISVRTA
jgi:hypothetical protein